MLHKSGARKARDRQTEIKCILDRKLKKEQERKMDYSKA